MEAMRVFSSAIGYLKDHMLTMCKNRLSDIEQSDIMWVLTVPAIWTDSAKQFMREAAEKVCIFFRFPKMKAQVSSFDNFLSGVHISVHLSVYKLFNCLTSCPEPFGKF